MKQLPLVAASALLLTLAGCGDSKFKGFEKAENGLHYRFFARDESGAKVQPGDGILIRYVISNHRNDSVIVDSKTVSRDGSGYTNFGLNKSSFRGSFEDGMMMMAKGDSAEFIVPADSFFIKSMGYNELPPGVLATDHLKGVFKIKDIVPAKEVEAERKRQAEERQAQLKELEGKEKTTLEAYLTENKVKVKPTASGLYIVETKKGSGPSPKVNEIVSVNYTGKLLDGNTFDSNAGQPPVEFPLAHGQLIEGWVEALQLMKKGGKATLILPSSLGYGDRGNGRIPPYSPMVFEVELVDIKPAPPTPQAPQEAPQGAPQGAQ
jgi:FKBP-type peptidyl-prolyl cis-trans isomerase FkpA